MTDTLTELQGEIIRLQTRSRYLEEEIRQKDGQIFELQKAHVDLKAMKRSASVHSSMPTLALGGLPQEFVAMKKGLKETMEKCQQLLSHLEMLTQSKTPVVVKSRDFQTQTSIVEELGEHTNGLKVTVNDLNQRLDDWRGSHIFHTQAVQHETFQDVFLKYQETTYEIEMLRNETLRLKRQADEYRQIAEKLTRQQETKAAEANESIQLLKHQSLAYSEDFLNERRDREAAQNRVVELEAQVEGLRKLVHGRELEQMEEIRRRREEALERYRLEYMQNRTGGGGSGLYQTDGMDVADDDGDQDGRDEIDSGPHSLNMVVKEVA